MFDLNKLKFQIKMQLIQKLNLRPFYDLCVSGALSEEGWLKSRLEKESIDSDGNPIPWITYPSLHFLTDRVTPDFTVFEYGCGGSTLWWALRVKEVFSVEHDNEWYQNIKSKIPDNVSLFYAPLEPDGEYSKKVIQTGKLFDVIVIDGRDRVNCAKNSLSALKPEGLILWDNSNRDKYSSGYDLLINNGFKRLDFFGMGPINLYSWCTSIFYRKENVFGL